MLGAGSHLTPLHHQCEGRPPVRLLRRRPVTPSTRCSAHSRARGNPEWVLHSRGRAEIYRLRCNSDAAVQPRKDSQQHRKPWL